MSCAIRLKRISSELPIDRGFGNLYRPFDAHSESKISHRSEIFRPIGRRKMRRRSVLAAGAGSAAAVLVGGTSASAAVNSGTGQAAGGAPVTNAPLRDLAAPIGLRFGTALIPQDIETPSYAAIASSQFSVVTPGNGMKWQIVEPEQGVYDWSQADQLVQFAQANGQLVRGHTLTWHNQLPGWLTTGVANGSISAAQLATLLHDHIITEVSRYRGETWGGAL